MSNLNLSEQEIVRRKALEELRKLGIDPYPAAKYDITTNSKEILEKFNDEEIIFKILVLPGRINVAQNNGKSHLFFGIGRPKKGEDTQVYGKSREIIWPRGKTQTFYKTGGF